MDHNTYFNKIAHKHYEKQKASLSCINNICGIGIHIIDLFTYIKVYASIGVKRFDLLYTRIKRQTMLYCIIANRYRMSQLIISI